MELRTKLTILADAAKYDASCASSGSKRAGREGALGNTTSIGICHSYTPDGRCVSLLKILLTNYCLYDCHYCINRITSDVPRARFTADEVVKLTMEFYKRNYIEGLFLSSGIIQSIDYTMEQLIEVARSLRVDHLFNGYIHLKTVPNVSKELLDRAGLYADRLSANIELPTQADLTKLAPEKKMVHVEETMSALRVRISNAKEEGKKSPKAPTFAPAGQSTQMIVGATPSTDATILQTASQLYRRQRLRRVYYSAYSPIPHVDGRLPALSPPLVREHRLYQADWLMRFYGFDVKEITDSTDGNLDLSIDPKLAWALRNRQNFPLNVNKATKEQLLRIPGVGVRNVLRILQLRRYQSIRLIDLKKLRLSMTKAKPWVITADYNPDSLLLDRSDLRDRIVTPPQQLNLFDIAASDPGTSARTGEL